MRVKCLAQERNTMSPARARTRSARSGVERANHEATAPPLSYLTYTLFFNKNVVFAAQTEYSYFSVDFRLKILNIAYGISVLEFIGVSITSVWYLDLNRVVMCRRVQVFSFCWLVSPFRERNNFIRFS